ncbi:MAG: N-(5'-phosphoribosyl)anthranilate isomerase [Jannaschia sp.]
MSYQAHIGRDEEWLAKLFSPRNLRAGGIVCRDARDVERAIGRRDLEQEVRARGFRMVQAGDQIVIVCTGVPVRVLV